MIPFGSRLLATLVLLLAAGCADTGAGRRAALDALDGRYAGALTPTSDQPGCGSQPKPFHLLVAGGHVAVSGHGRSNRLFGIVDADGQVTAQNGKGDHVLTGTIAAGRFSGFETTPGPRPDHGIGERNRTCVAQAMAVRGSTGPDAPASASANE